MAAAGVAVAALAIRPITSFDIGYHLAYGDHFLRTGRIVQTNRFGIYTTLDAGILADGGRLGPGCAFDAETGTYHFPNANWLSQVAFATVYQVGGMTGLCLLRAALILAVFGVVAWTMRRGGVGWGWIGPGVILAAVAAFERFDLRPELVAYLILAIQWRLLSAGRFTWRRAAGVVAMQVVFVNVHSYFLFGAALAAAMLIDAVLRWLWARSVTQTDPGDLTARLKWLAVATAGVLLGCLCNPWGLRGAILPIQTALYIRQHHILAGARIETTAAGPRLIGHPWSMIGEIVPTFSRGLWIHPGTLALAAAMALAAAAGVVAIARRRIGWLLVAAGTVAVALSSRRGIALGGLFLTLLAGVSFADGWRWIIRRHDRPPLRRSANALTALASVASIAAGVALTAAVVTNAWYLKSRFPWRFGVGVSNLMIPTGPAEWINRHRPAGRVWSDFANSSNLLLLTGRDMPLLTNTWAYPPYLMKKQMEITAGLVPLEPFADRYDANTVVLRRGQRRSPLIGWLSRSTDWTPVLIDAAQVVFVRAGGPTADLAAAQGLTERFFDARPFVERIAARDPASAGHDAVIAVLDESQRRWPGRRDTLSALVRALEQRGDRRRAHAGEFLKQRNPGEARKARTYQRAAKLPREHRDLGVDPRGIQRKIEALGKWTLPSKRTDADGQ